MKKWGTYAIQIGKLWRKKEQTETVIFSGSMVRGNFMSDFELHQK